MNDITCCKCGFDKIGIKWKEHHRPYETHFSETVRDNECLICTCLRCGYLWRNPTLDNKGKG